MIGRELSMMREMLLAGALAIAGSQTALGANATCPGETLIKSAATEIETEITFENSGNSPRQIHWIDFDGKRVHYGDIAPGASHQQPAYLGQAWMITDKNADCLGIYYAETMARYVSLDDGTAASDAPPRANPPRPGTGNTSAAPLSPDTKVQPVAIGAGNPCELGEYWNRSRNICINTSNNQQRRPNSDSSASNNQVGSGGGLACRAGFVKVGSRCVRDDNGGGAPVSNTSAAAGGGLSCRSGFVKVGTRCARNSDARAPAPVPSRPAAAGAGLACRAGFVKSGSRCVRQGAANTLDASNEENRPGDLCGPGFTDIGGGCISNALLPKSQN